MTEFAVLVLFAASGMLLMASSRSLVTAFIALELAALPSYALVAFAKKDRAGVEGAMKYFLLGALTSAVLLYGISLVYGATGTFDFVGIADALAGGDSVGLAGLGALLILVGLGFKIAAFPFHVWAPDAYTGAPTPVAAFLSSASKIAGFVLLFRLFVVAFPAELDWLLAVQILAVATMTLRQLRRRRPVERQTYARLLLDRTRGIRPDSPRRLLGGGPRRLRVRTRRGHVASVRLRPDEHRCVPRSRSN